MNICDNNDFPEKCEEYKSLCGKAKMAILEYYESFREDNFYSVDENDMNFSSEIEIFKKLITNIRKIELAESFKNLHSHVSKIDFATIKNELRNKIAKFLKIVRDKIIKNDNYEQIQLDLKDIQELLRLSNEFKDTVPTLSKEIQRIFNDLLMIF